MNGIGFPIYHRPGHDGVQCAGVTPHRFPEYKRKLVGTMRVRIGSGASFRCRRYCRLRNQVVAARPYCPATASILAGQTTVHANAIYRLSDETPVTRRRATETIILNRKRVENELRNSSRIAGSRIYDRRYHGRTMIAHIET